jgi:hypothetical protein
MQEKNLNILETHPKRKKGLLFFKNPRRPFMSTELECPICDADIPLEGDEKSGDLMLCSYCKVTLKLLRKKGKWILTEDFDE